MAARGADRRPDRGRRSTGRCGDSPARDAVDWSRVDVWWGDERFLPAGHPDRNETQAREALLDALPLDPARVHPMPPSDGPDGDDPEAAAARYAARAGRRGPARARPRCRTSTCCCSASARTGTWPRSSRSTRSRTRPGPVSAVRGSPKPPPVRITLTLPAINTAEEVWLIAAGAGQGRRGGDGAGRRRAGAAAGGRRARRRTARSGCSTGRAASRGAARACAACAEPHRSPGRPRARGACQLRSPRRGRRCSASARIAAPSASLRRSFTYARWDLYGSARGRPGGFCRSWPAGRPQRGQSHVPARGASAAKQDLDACGRWRTSRSTSRRGAGSHALARAHRAGADPAAADCAATCHGCRSCRRRGSARKRRRRDEVAQQCARVRNRTLRGPSVTDRAQSLRLMRRCSGTSRLRASFSQRPRPTMQANQTMPTRTV